MKFTEGRIGTIIGKRAGLIIIILVSIATGFLLHAVLTTGTGTEPPAASTSQEVWTCSMHPQIRSDKPGKCPICGMNLYLVTKDNSNRNPHEFTTSQTAKALMDIETTKVERRFVVVPVRMVGKVDYDETKLVYITAWVPGRLDRLYVDYTGVPVQKGHHLVSIYSPELLSAQEEMLQAKQAVKNIQNSDSKLMRDMTQATYIAAREKLLLLGLSEKQVAAIEQTGKGSDHITINSPVTGIVIHKNAKEGMYVTTGTRIYTVADLSQMWVQLDAYESDLMWLRYGQKVDFTTVAYPGEVFKGTISFIDPILNSATRTVKVRVNVPNSAGKLKPGMFVKAVVHSQVAAGGKVMDSDLAGKWISPMHPEIIKDAPGKCDVCGMPLVRTESLGYVSVDPKKADRPLVIPATAPLITGKRAVVYVEVPGADKPTFQGREIVLGPRAGKYYIVRSGLKEGEVVVTRGAFKIDSALQISAKPSMMSPKGGVVPGGHAHHGGKPPVRDNIDKSAPAVDAKFLAQLKPIYQAYFDTQKALVADDVAAAVKTTKDAENALAAVDMKLVTGEDHMAWMKGAESLKKILAELANAKTIEPAREAFALYSEQMAVLARRFGSPISGSLYEIKCPMAFDGRGAIWLQDNQTVRNPYFGKVMLQCGEVQNVYTSPKAPPEGSP
ncbi:MAG: efflux RND transporter periplasmic adaptor subunit [Phycisphaerae bacterium]|nr:efflux RND transporter periplasmic adaptor subunit [Phycisphaerae bacterium]